MSLNITSPIYTITTPRSNSITRVAKGKKPVSEAVDDKVIAGATAAIPLYRQTRLGYEFCQMIENFCSQFDPDVGEPMAEKMKQFFDESIARRFSDIKQPDLIIRSKMFSRALINNNFSLIIKNTVISKEVGSATPKPNSTGRPMPLSSTAKPTTTSIILPYKINGSCRVNLTQIVVPSP